MKGWTHCIVAASGPSLTYVQAELCIGHHVIAVNDAWRILPFADVLYACDAKWWDAKQPDFIGERWSTHDPVNNEKRECAVRHRLHLIDGADESGFSLKPDLIHYGGNSGFQALNLAILFGAKDIILIGYDMREVDGREHFFGSHPEACRNPLDFNMMINQFQRAKVPPGVRIVNSTPGSALNCYPKLNLAAALAEWELCVPARIATA